MRNQQWFSRPIRPARLAMLALLVMLVSSWAACSNPTREELASLAARGYYQHLVDGDYDHFLEGRLMADSLPDDYRSQLNDAYAQFLAQQTKMIITLKHRSGFSTLKEMGGT